MKLTSDQRKALLQMETHGRIRFESEAGQEAVCQLDAMGMANVYTDAASSLGFVYAEITDAGRDALKASEGDG